MSDAPDQWDDLSRLWHAEGAAIRVEDVEATARRERREMVTLAIVEAGALALAFIAAMWIAIHTALLTMTAISMVFFAVCGFLQHRMRREPQPSGGDDLTSSLAVSIAREEWNLAQLGVGRAVTLVTLFAIVMVASNHLRLYAITPASRLWALCGIAAIVGAILVWNLLITRRARARKARLESFSQLLRAGPELPLKKAA